MHELGIVKELVNLAEGELSRIGDFKRVTTLTLSIGKFSGVHPEAIRFAFDVISPSTRLNGAQLNIKEPKPFCQCRDCGTQNEIDEIPVVCPTCASTNIIIEGGQDLNLISIDIEE